MELPESENKTQRIHRLQREAENAGNRTRARELYVLENKVIQGIATEMEVEMCCVDGWSE